MTSPKLTIFYVTLLHLATLVVAESEEVPQSCEDLGNKDSHYVCNERGEIRCLAGWSGEKCDVPKCAEGCHPVHGFCTKPGECRCELGWRGEGCNECTPLPGCQHGYCNNGTFECFCEEGWEGIFCSQPKCREGCHSTRGYCDRPGECKCRIGWGGPTCEECKPLPGCVHGNCTKPLECKCEPGWSGVFCHTPICSENCNKEHGSCTKPDECRCEVGWWGENCDLCFPYPGCQHGGCKKPWECLCEEGWKGMLCDEPDDESGKCINNPGACLNGGTCIDVPNTGNFTCSCPSLFTGQRCDYLAELSSSEAFTEPDDLEPTDSTSQIHLITPDDNSPTGSFSLLQSSKRPGEGTRKQRIDLSKEERRIILQNTARISFRQPKIISKEDNQSDSLPFKVIERKLLPLPVFLPRVSEIIPGDEGPTRILKAVTKQPTPLLVLETQGDSDNVVIKDTLTEIQDNTNGNQIDENRRFLRHHEGAFISEIEDAAEAELSRNSQSGAPRHNRVIKVSSLGDQPLLVSAHASALPRPNPVSPATLRTRPIPSQQSEASSKQISTPSSTTIAPEDEGSSTTMRSAKNALPQARSSHSPPTDTLSAQARSSQSPPIDSVSAQARSSQSAPIDSVSAQSRSSQSILIESLSAQSRSSQSGPREPVSAQARSSLPPPTDTVSEEEDVIAQGSEDFKTYYEQNSNGRVHIGDVIGVDDAAPHKEIYEAFIELKKV